MLYSLCLWVGLCGPPSDNAVAIDGDTVSIMGVHIRLQGIDAEELNEPHGHEAKYALQGLINQGIACKLTGEKSYNRYVGTCHTANGMDIGAEMVRLGFALDCAHYSHGQYKPLEPPDIHRKLIQKPYC